MSSAKKSKPSTSENQEPDRDQPQPPDDSRRQEDALSPIGGQLPETSSIGVTSSPPTATGILDSIIGSSVDQHTRAGDILGRTAGTEYVDELTPPRNAKGSTEFYEVCTEILGFESMLEKMDLSTVIEAHPSRLIILSSRKTKMCRVIMRDKCRPRVLPPFLSTLYRSGRPRFRLEKVTGSDGRLNIVMVDYKADFVGGGDDQEVDGGNGELKNDDHEMNIGDRQDDHENKEGVADDDRKEEMIGDNLVDQEVDDGEMNIGDPQDDDDKDENKEEG